MWEARSDGSFGIRRTLPCSDKFLELVALKVDLHQPHTGMFFFRCFNDELTTFDSRGERIARTSMTASCQAISHIVERVYQDCGSNQGQA